MVVPPLPFFDRSSRRFGGGSASHFLPPNLNCATRLGTFRDEQTQALNEIDHPHTQINPDNCVAAAPIFRHSTVRFSKSLPRRQFRPREIMVEPDFGEPSTQLTKNDSSVACFVIFITRHL